MESIAAPPLAEVLADIPDCRAARGKRHGLLPILLLVCVATRCGARSPTAIAAWGKDYGPPWLRRLGFTKDYGPSQSTLCRLVQRVAYAAIEAALRQWAERVMAQAAMGELGGVALDGKTLRRAHDRTNGKAPLHMVSAWASGSGLVLGPLAVDDKSNELTAIPALLRLLDLAGSTVTIDAMGCQTAIAAQIVAQGGDSAPALKDDPPALHAEVAEAFAAARATGFADDAPADHDYAETVGQDHGRPETRRSWTIRDPDLVAYLNQGEGWAGLRAVGLVERERRVGEAVTVEARHYLLSGAGETAAFGHAVRAHWGIENRVH